MYILNNTIHSFKIFKSEVKLNITDVMTDIKDNSIKKYIFC